MDIQIVAFPQYGILSYPQGKELLEDSLKMGADAAGAIPHFEFTREYSVESLNICFEPVSYTHLVLQPLMRWSYPPSSASSAS